MFGNDYIIGLQRTFLSEGRGEKMQLFPAYGSGMHGINYNYQYIIFNTCKCFKILLEVHSTSAPLRRQQAQGYPVSERKL